MRKLALILCAVAIGIATAASAKEVVKYDANGNPWYVDSETAMTPGAGSGEGAIIGEVPTRTKFDLQLGVTAAGAPGDDNANSETMITGIAGLFRPAAWVRIGGAMQWDTVDRAAIDLSVPMSAQLFPNPWGNVIFWLNADILPHYTIRTSDNPDETPRKNAWSWIPSVGLSVELPIGESAAWSTEVGAGVGVPVTVEGISDEALNSLVNKVAGAVDFRVNIRLGR